jgi:carboxypeptidase C (cathepsin A)
MAQWSSFISCCPVLTTIFSSGGPGCTSLLGAFYENGPFMLRGMANGSYDLHHNPFGWNEVAHTIFVEQPIRFYCRL